MEKEKVILVSVVRDQDMYNRCIVDNPYVADCRKVMLDNTVENIPITTHYNNFIKDVIAESDDAWVVFCHEDWEATQSVVDCLDGRDHGCLYGNIGSYVKEFSKVDAMMNMGYVLHQSKAGGKPSAVRGKKVEGRADTFDCQCVIAHTSLLRDYNLSFDENLKFDMYVEDFCIAAFENHGIKSRTISLAAVHHSKGTLSDAFYAALEYVRAKYAHSKKRYSTIVGRKNVIGGDPDKPYYKWKHSPVCRLRFKLGI